MLLLSCAVDASTLSCAFNWVPPKACLLPDARVKSSLPLASALSILGVPLLGLPEGVANMLAVHVPEQSRPLVVAPGRFVCGYLFVPVMGLPERVENMLTTHVLEHLNRAGLWL